MHDSVSDFTREYRRSLQTAGSKETDAQRTIRQYFDLNPITLHSEGTGPMREVQLQYPRGFARRPLPVVPTARLARPVVPPRGTVVANRVGTVFQPVNPARNYLEDLFPGASSRHAEIEMTGVVPASDEEEESEEEDDDDRSDLVDLEDFDDLEDLERHLMRRMVLKEKANSEVEGITAKSLREKVLQAEAAAALRGTKPKEGSKKADEHTAENQEEKVPSTFRWVHIEIE